MRNGFPAWLVLLAMLLASGCRNGERVENELRARDVQYREALEELMRNEAMNEDLRRENEALRAGGKLTPEQASQVYGVRKIVIGRGTAGIDNDRVPGDEALQVWIEPRDASDHTIKVPGKLQIAVLEINPQGTKSLLSTWDIEGDKLQQSWKQGLLSIGYMVQLPWKTPPRVETIRVYARFTTPDGRVFEADKDVKVRLMPGAAARPETTQTETPIFRPAPVIMPAGSPLQPASHWTPAGAATPTAKDPWQSQPLQDAVNLSRPLPMATPGSQWNRPVIGEIRVDD